MEHEVLEFNQVATSSEDFHYDFPSYAPITVNCNPILEILNDVGNQVALLGSSCLSVTDDILSVDISKEDIQSFITKNGGEFVGTYTITTNDGYVFKGTIGVNI